jgi:septum site-determining protein MinC
MSVVHPMKLVNAQMQVLRARLRSMDCADIRLRLQDVRGLGFLDQPAVIDVSGVPIEGLIAANWPEILGCFRAVGLSPVALTGLADPKLQSALAERLALAPVDAASLGLKLAGVDEPDTSTTDGGGHAGVADPDRANGGPATADGAQRPISQEQSWMSPMIVDRQVRSGQQIYARQRDLIVLAAVSPGAEVIADGNVTCYGALRGRAIAGASGKGDAFIHALDFRPELVAVAGLYMTFESGPPTMPGGRVVQVRLDAAGDRLVMDTI